MAKFIIRADKANLPPHHLPLIPGLALSLLIFLVMAVATIGLTRFVAQLVGGMFL